MELKDIKYSFKEACNLTGYKDSVIRYYEKEFNLNITRDSNGRRIFNKTDIEKLLYIKNLQQQGFNNSQIKKMMANDEVAATVADVDFTYNDDNVNITNENDIIKTIEDKLNEINIKLEELDKNVFNKERDILISENMKLKMELKQKCYEIIELKEKLRYEKESKKGILKILFKK